MLPTLSKDTVDHEDWIYEIKWDGYRALAHTAGGVARLISRNGKSLNERFPRIVAAIASTGMQAVFDGEVVALDEDGMPDFHALQYSERNQDDIYFYIFDILWLDGYTLVNLPLAERKKILEQVMPKHERLLLSKWFEGEGKGTELFEAAKELNMEGIVAKRKDSIYRPGERVHSWLKVKHMPERSFVIGGWTEPENKQRKFGTLLLGEYLGEDLIYKDHCGSGFSDRDEEMIMRFLKPLEAKRKTFRNEVVMRSPIHWVKPGLVADFALGRRLDGTLQDTWFWKGWRKDINPKNIVYET